MLAINKSFHFVAQRSVRLSLSLQTDTGSTHKRSAVRAAKTGPLCPTIGTLRKTAAQLKFFGSLTAREEFRRSRRNGKIEIFAFLFQSQDRQSPDWFLGSKKRSELNLCEVGVCVLIPGNRINRQIAVGKLSTAQLVLVCDVPACLYLLTHPQLATGFVVDVFRHYLCSDHSPLSTISLHSAF